MNCLSRDCRTVVRRRKNARGSIIGKNPKVEVVKSLEAVECRLREVNGEGMDDVRLELMKDKAMYLSDLGHYTKALNVFVTCLRMSNNDPILLAEAVTTLVDAMASSIVSDDVTSKKDGKSEEQQQPTTRADAWSCSSCLGVLMEPASLGCGHSYCRKCLPAAAAGCRKCGLKSRANVAVAQNNVLVTRLCDKFWKGEQAAVALRGKGNELFAKGKMEGALEVYSKAVSLAPTDHLLLGNRAQVMLKLKQPVHALCDTDSALRERPHWAKGHYRRALALQQLGRMEEAFVALYKCLALEETKGTKPLKAEMSKVLKELIVRKCEEEEHAHRTRANSSVESSPMRERTTTTGAALYAMFLDEATLEVETFLSLPPPPVQEPRAIAEGACVASDFDCPLCFRLLFQPLTTACGHTFCKRCLDRSLDHSSACPMCKGSLSLHLAERRDAEDEFVSESTRRLLPADYAERQLQHDAEMAELAGAGIDPQHEIPIFVCTMSFPSIPCPLHVFEPRYKLMIRRCMETGTREFGMCQGQPDRPFADYGTMLEIRDIQYFPDGRAVVDTVGGRRFRVINRGIRDGYHSASVEFLKDVKLVSDEAIADIQKLQSHTLSMCTDWFTNLEKEITEGILAHYGRIPDTEADFWKMPNGPAWVWWVLAILPLDPSTQLRILSNTSLKLRLEEIQKVIVLLKRKQQQDKQHKRHREAAADAAAGDENRA